MAAKRRRTFRELVDASGIPQRSLAQRIGTDQATLWRWLDGRTKPNIRFLEPLADALDVDLVDVVRAFAEK